MALLPTSTTYIQYYTITGRHFNTGPPFNTFVLRAQFSTDSLIFFYFVRNNKIDNPVQIKGLMDNINFAFRVYSHFIVPLINCC